MIGEYTDLAQIITPIIALLGIAISMWLSVRALREVQKDRRMRQMPHLAFGYGGAGYLIMFVNAGRAVLGINPRYAEIAFSDFPADAESVRLKPGVEYGKLRNYGLGTALSTEVTWVPQRIQIGSEIFTLEKDKLLEPRYSKNLNCIPSSPSHILPGEMATFIRLPTFIQKDHEKKIKEVEGTLVIECEDIFGLKHVTNQEFRIFTDYGADKPIIYITFGDLTK
jgi:hypothetical protein